MEQVERGREMDVDGPVQVADVAIKHEVAGVLEPAALVGNVTAPGVVVGVGVEVGESQHNTGEHDDGGSDDAKASAKLSAPACCVGTPDRRSFAAAHRLGPPVRLRVSGPPRRASGVRHEYAGNWLPGKRSA